MRSDVLVKKVDPIYVVSVRRKVAGQAALVAAVNELRPMVEAALTGPAMGLRLGFPRDGMVDVDIAFPVAPGTEVEGFEAKTLPELPMFSITHVGPIVDGPEGTNLVDSRRKLVEFVNETGVLIGDDPERFLYHEGAETHGNAVDRYVTEVQYAYHMPMWLAALDRGTKRFVGADAAKRVMQGSAGLAEALDGQRAAEWVHGAIERLDREVADETARACILNGCAHHYIVQSGMVMEAALQETGRDVRKLVAKITDEKLLGSEYWIDETGPQPLVMIRRRPARPDEFEKARTPQEKRYQACFCPLVRDAILKGKPVSRTFCHCSGGWYAQEWAIAFGQTPDVRLVETMLEGKDACVFAVVIPEGWL